MVDTKIKKIAAAVIIVIAVIGIAGIALQNKTTSQEDASTNKNPASAKEEVKASAQKEVVTLKVGGYGEPDGIIAPQIAEELGYYDGQIHIENAYIPALAEAATALVTGDVDVTTHTTWLSIVRLYAKGAKIKGVALSHGPSANSSGLLVLADSPIRSAKDLKGKKLGGGTGLTSPGQSFYLLTYYYLKNANLSIKKDVELITIPSGQEDLVLQTKQVDAVWGSYKTIGRLRARGIETRLLFTPDDAVKDWHHCGFIVTEKFIKENPELLKVLVPGFVKGLDWERDNPDKAKELHIAKGKKPEEVRKYYLPTDIRKHALIEDKDLQVAIDYLVDIGELKPGQIKPSDIYTNEFNPYYKK